MKKFIAMLLSVCCLFSVTGCGGDTVNNTEKNLVIEMYLGGYGADGMKALEKRFEEIYAEEGLTVSIIPNAGLVNAGAYQNLQLGTNSPTDLFFVGNVDIPYIIGEGKNFVKSTDYDYALEDLTSLYDSKVYGEEVLYKNKLNKSSVEFNKQNDGKFYSTNWASGVTGISYRRENFGEGKWTLPRTTKELEETMKLIKADGKYPFVYCGTTAAYFNYVALTWWRQFASDEEVSNFWNCLSEDEEGNLVESADAFKTYSRLQAYKNVEMCIYDTTNAHPKSMTFNNAEAQTALYNSNNKVMMMPAGDWQENEMANIDIKSDIGLMKTPVTSDILKKSQGAGLVDRFTSIKTEAQLRSTITAIDNNLPSLEGVTQEDYAELKKIRSYDATEGFSHTAYIPSHANAKDAAKKFLLFMASDEAVQLYYNATSCFLPFDSKNVTLKPDATPYQKDVLSIMNGANYVSMHDSKNPLFFKTELDFNVNEFFMDARIGTTDANDKLTGKGWFDLVAKDVEENLSLYQGIVNAGK